MSYDYLSKAGVGELVANIKAKYATKTSIPTKVSDLTNDSNFRTGDQVDAAITSAIAGVTQFDYEIVAELPAEGEKGVIYLVANSGSGSNIYDEYIWIVIGEGSSAVGHFEKFGEKMVELVEYVGDTANITVSDGTGADAGKKVISISSAMATSLGLADTALQSVASAGGTIEVSGVGTDKNLEVASSIVDGAANGETALKNINDTGYYSETIDLVDHDAVPEQGIEAFTVLEVKGEIVSGAAAGATAVQPGDLVAMTNSEIDALFADTSSSGSQG